MKTRKGSTLLELIISMSMMMMISVNLILITTLSMNFFESYLTKNEMYNSGRLGIEFIRSQFELHNNFKIIYLEDNRLKEIVIYKDDNRVEKDANVINYVYNKWQVNSDTIGFGGKDNNGDTHTNTLVEYIENVEVLLEKDLIKIVIKINVTPGIEDDTKVYEFMLTIDTRGKNIEYERYNKNQVEM